VPSYLLGDAGTALRHAESLPISQIPTVERQARLLVDTTLAAARWDKPAFSDLPARHSFLLSTDLAGVRRPLRDRTRSRRTPARSGRPAQPWPPRTD
jgi:hypothetical protein